MKRRGASRWLVDLVLLFPDLHKIYTQFRRRMGVTPRLFRPRTFNDWMQHSKIFNRKAHHPVIADKLASRAYIAERIEGAEFAKVLWAGTNLRDAPRDTLPSRFVIKTNQRSSRNIIVDDARLLDWEAAVAATDKLLEQDHSAHCAEWQYRWIPPRVFIEALLETPEGGVPIEYQFFCIRGKCRIIEMNFERRADRRRLYFDRNLNKLDLEIRFPSYTLPFTFSPDIGVMLEAAERLAANEPFLRVDIYDAGRPVFGELTLHPASGMVKFQPEAWDHILGRCFSERSPA